MFISINVQKVPQVGTRKVLMTSSGNILKYQRTEELKTTNLMIVRSKCHVTYDIRTFTFLISLKTARSVNFAN